MAKRKFILTKAEQKELLQAYRLCKDAATRTRYQAVRLYGEGYPEAEIEEITGCSRTSLLEWCRAYREDASQGLVDKRVGGTRAKLSKLELEELQQTLHQYTPKERLGSNASTVDGQNWSVEDLVQVVRERYGVEYQSRTSYTQLLRKCGFSYQKTEKVFKSRSETKVADFEEQLEKN
jgi:putative transposase